MFVVVVYVVCRAKIEEEKKLRGKRRRNCSSEGEGGERNRGIEELKRC